MGCQLVMDKRIDGGLLWFETNIATRVDSGKRDVYWRLEHNKLEERSWGNH